MKRPCLPFWRGWLLAACLFSGAANASVVIATTRVIYPGEEAEVTVSLSNQGERPSLVQVWVDDGRADVPVEQLRVPFSLTPALFRLDPGKGQALRLFQGQHDFAQDRESLYWLNVLDIPPKGEGNALQVAVRSRIKLLYRPRGLAGNAQQAPQALTWRLLKGDDAWALEASNPSGFYVNLAELSVHLSGRNYEATSSHIDPLSTRLFALPGLERAEASTATVHFASVNDYGAVLPAQQPAEVVRPH
ncbi:fimbrial biogenesis chaperone [Pseudomonas putida]|uniref:fimbrial biogenesis chaperone n=1 Tax=Pseudomonas putida TaxID=303 RepID=UPI002366E8AE|nr:fimbria/pilus periplasmic chaperone [Pseudomonas putida]MDD2046026.1 fimbria/pilus periplasmic chaperone [Pseudomonas putida]